MKYPYDNTNPKEIELYANSLIGKTFREVMETSIFLDGYKDEFIEKYENPNNKGGLGNIVQEAYFGYEVNNEATYDFDEAELELKVTCYDVLKNGKKSAGERLSLEMIAIDRPVEDDFYKSTCWTKCGLILLIYYERDKNIKDKLDYIIKYVKLFTPPEDDLVIIESDYKIIIDKIKNGIAETLSESDTMYLGAAPKGAGRGRDLRPQYYYPHNVARRRGYCYKRNYMDVILNDYILGNVNLYDKVLKDVNELKTKSFSEILKDRVIDYKGISIKELCSKFDLDIVSFKKHKSLLSVLTFRMLGVKSNNAQEFIKANIIVKTVRLEQNGKNIESMSLPVFKFLDLANEEVWEESELYNYFVNSKFLFSIFQNTDDGYVFKGLKLWSISGDDLILMERDWKAARKIIREGVKFKFTYQKNGKLIIKNNFPGLNQTNIVHVRPHAAKSAYRINGEVYGDLKNANELPNGDMLTNSCFFINNYYILKQIQD
ncbi:MAG: Sau3AI family type II restriction endonuclease [Bacillota bacterium]|nr:Sau3AI family type II restriction endonuclease [Bacillota bacterium]